MLVGTFTWLRPKDSTVFEEAEEHAAEDAEDEDWQFEGERDLEQKLQDMEADAKLAEEAAAEAEKTVEDLMQALEETDDAQEVEEKEVGGSPIADAFDEIEEVQEVEKKEREIPKDVRKKILSMLVLMASAPSLKGQNGNADEQWTVVAIYTILVVITTLWCSQWIASMMPRRNEQESTVHERSESREESPMTTEELYNLASKVKKEAERSLEAEASAGYGRKDSKKESPKLP